MARSTVQQNIIYADFDNNFTMHPVSNDLGRLINENAVKRAIKNLLFTNQYERPFKPSLGGNINKLLFENLTPTFVYLVETTIRDTITNFEPRANLIDVIVSPYEDHNALNITVVFSVINKEDPIRLEFVLDRVR